MAAPGTATIDCGSTPVAEASVSVSVPGMTSANYVEAFVQVDSTTDNDVESHRHAAASWKLVCEAGTDGFTLNISSLMDLFWGTFKIRYVYA